MCCPVFDDSACFYEVDSGRQARNTDNGVSGMSALEQAIDEEANRLADAEERRVLRSLGVSLIGGGHIVNEEALLESARRDAKNTRSEHVKEHKREVVERMIAAQRPKPEFQ